MKFQRRGPGDGNRRCERVVYTLDLRGLVARNSYANVYDWFIGDNIEAQLNSGTWDVGDSGSNGNFIFDDTLYYGGTTTSTELWYCSTNSISNIWYMIQLKLIICVLQELLIILVVEIIIF